MGLSTSPCWKRINKLQVDGIIFYDMKQYLMLQSWDLPTVFMMIKTGEHSGPGWKIC